MDKLKITGNTRLEGEVKASGAKNAVLPILTATLLSEQTSVIKNVPNLRDVHTTEKLLTHLGAQVSFKDHTFKTQANHITDTTAPYDLVKTMRASVLVLGPLLARFGKVCVSLPGGCAIGTRPIDQHLRGFEALGAKISIENGFIHAASQNQLKGARIIMDIVTVTGTENLLMAATLANGTTILENAAKEPEVDDLANMLNKMGAQIEGIGSDTLTIHGVEKLTGCEHSVMPDRIETATFLVAAMMTKGHVRITNTDPKTLDAALAKLQEAGANIKTGDDWIELSMSGEIKPINIRTAPHPAFPTDLQAQFMALNAISSGHAHIVETIFENRFMHVPELCRMGANISIEGRNAYIEGVSELIGAPVMATDLRASASLVLAALAAKGTTIIDRVYHLDRGYEKIEDKLSALGAKIERISA